MILVADAGPLLHLHWIGASVWALPPDEVRVVESVRREVEQFAPEALGYPSIRLMADPAVISPQVASLALHRGETVALSYALEAARAGEVMLLCDERKARNACLALGLRVTGSLGLILQARAAGRVDRDAARQALEELPVRGNLWLAPAVVQRAVEALDEPGPS